MGFFKKDKKLYDYDPKELDLELLSHLQAGLVAKLVLVNEELISRYKNIVELGSEIKNSENQITVLIEGAKHLENINLVLHSELIRITGKTGNAT